MKKSSKFNYHQLGAAKLKKGQNILFAAVGSGWTYGAAILKWA